jgi:crossover junction endodeoxyribonuclease RuvC
MYRILGIDPGLRQTGFGVLDCDKNTVTYIKSGLIKTEATNKHLPDRLKTIFEGVLEIIETYKPNVMSIEKTFVNMNPQSSLSLGHARGMAIAAAIHNNMDIFEYTALQIKKSVVGHGHAKKLQVQSMVQRLLDLPEILGPDSSDALASALCHFRIAPTNILKKGNSFKGGRVI